MQFQRNNLPRTLLLALSLIVLLGGFQGDYASAQTSSKPAPQAQLPQDYSWSSSTDISQAQTALYPRLGMNANDTIVFYGLGNTSVENGYTASSDDYGRTWGGRGFRTTPGGSTKGSSGLGADVDAQGNDYLAWEDYAYDPRSLAFRKYNAATGTFEPIKRLNGSNTNGVDLAVAPDGTIHISYVAVIASGSRAVVRYIKSTDGGNTFSTAVDLSDGRTFVKITSIAVDTAGRPHVAWDGQRGNTYGIYSNDFVNGSWTGPLLHEASASYWPRLAQDNNGGVGLVWQTNFGGQADIFLLRWNGANQQWDPTPTNASDTPDSSFYPSIAFNTQGSAYIAWSENNGGGTEALFFSYEFSPRSNNFSNIQRVEDERTTNSDIASYNNQFTLAYATTHYSPSWKVYGRYLSAGNVPTNTPAAPTGTPTITSTPTTVPTNTPAPTATPCADGSIFRDVCANSHWAYLYIQGLGLRGIVSGQNGYYYPDSLVKRGEFAKFVVKAQGWPLVNPTTPSFNDVPSSNIFYQYIETAVQRGAINGYSTIAQCVGTTAPCYLPNSAIRRNETAVIIVRANQFALTTPPAPNFTFTDVPRNAFAWAEIETLAAKGIMNGISAATFNPSGHTKRGEMAKIIYLTFPQVNSFSPPQAPAGGNQAVTVIGKLFGESQISSTLTVNNTPVDVMSWSDQAITFRLPANTPISPAPAQVVLIVNGRAAFFSSSANLTVLAGPSVTATSAVSSTATLTAVSSTATATTISTATLTLTASGTATAVPTLSPTALVK